MGGKREIVIFWFVCFSGAGGFQGVPGGCGYVLTKFGPEPTHLDLVHTRVDVSLNFSAAFLRYSLIYQCQRHTGCVGSLYYICVQDTYTQAVLEACMQETNRLCSGPIYLRDKHTGCVAALYTCV